MFNPLSAAQTVILREAIASCGLEQWETEITERAQAAIRFEAVTDTPESTSQNRPKPLSCLGGLPEVPPGWVWPENVLFFAQLDCSELAPCDCNGLLPPTGLLSFFASQYLEGAVSGTLCHVFYFPDTSVLKRAPAPPKLLPRKLKIYDEDAVYCAHAVRPISQITLPSSYSSDMRDLNEVLDDDRYFQLQRDLEPPRVALVSGVYQHRLEDHQVLGHHGFVDGDLADVVGLSRADLEADEWVLLLQLESDDHMGWSFWDAGRFLFAISTQDLKDHRFDRVRGGLWSS